MSAFVPSPDVKKNRISMQYGINLSDMTSRTFQKTMKKLEKQRDKEIRGMKVERQNAVKEKYVSDVENIWKRRCSIYSSTEREHPSTIDFTKTPHHERRTSISSKKQLHAIRAEAGREYLGSAINLLAESPSAHSHALHMFDVPLPKESSIADNMPEDLNKRLTNFLANADTWCSPKATESTTATPITILVPNTQETNAPSDIKSVTKNVTPLGEFHGDTHENTRFIPGCKEREPRKKSPKWHRHKLEPKSTDSVKTPNAKTREDASKYVMNDLVGRSRGKDHAEFEKAKAILKRDAEEALRRREELQRQKREQRSRDKDTIAMIKTADNAVKQNPHLQRRETLDALYAETDNKSLLQTAEEFIDLGFKSELKVRLLKDYICTKRWHPSERDTMNKMKRLLDHWAKITKQIRENNHKVESIAWSDEEEKSFFSKLLAQMKERNEQLQYDPWKILHTAYLRIDKDAAKELEKMCRDMGKDPGIHVHAETVDFYDTNIFKDDSMPSVAAIASQVKDFDMKQDSRKAPSRMSDRRRSAMPDSFKGRRGTLFKRSESRGHSSMKKPSTLMVDIDTSTLSFSAPSSQAKLALSSTQARSTLFAPTKDS